MKLFQSMFVAFAFLGSGSTLADDQKPDLTLADIVQRLATSPPSLISFDHSSALALLNRERSASRVGGNIVGISPVQEEFSSEIRIVAPQRTRIKGNRSGLYFKNKVGAITFGKRLNLGQPGYYELAFAKRNAWVSKVRLVDESGRISFLRPSSSGLSDYVISDPIKGPNVSLILSEIEPQLVPTKLRISRIAFLDVPEDPTAVLADTDTPFVGSTVPAFTSAELHAVHSRQLALAFRFKYQLPNDFVDFSCALNDSLRGQFSNDLGTLSSAIGLLEVFRRTASSNIIISYCTAFHAQLASGVKAIITSRACLGSNTVAANPKDVLGLRIFWDYRNSTCGPQPPGRWAMEKIADLPSTQLDGQSIAGTANDVVALKLETELVGRAAIPFGGSSGPYELFRFMPHHSDLRPLLGSYQIWNSPIDSSTVPAPCASLPSATFSYSLQLLKPTSSAAARGGFGAPFLGQGTTALGVSSANCLGTFNSVPADFSVDGKADGFPTAN